MYNVEELNKHYRTYALDTIGDTEKSVLDDVNHHPNDGKSLSDLYTELSLNLEWNALMSLVLLMEDTL